MKTPHCVPGGEAESSEQQPRRVVFPGGLTVRTFVTVPGRDGYCSELWPLWGFELIDAAGKVLERSGFELEDTDGFLIEEDAYRAGMRAGGLLL